MDINEILRQIRFGSLDNDELNQLIEAVRYRRSQLVEQNRHTLSVGCKVQFRNSRTGQLINGTVNKINRKFVIVSVINGSNWRVPGNMLEKV
jgi:hypothetical protein